MTGAAAVVETHTAVVFLMGNRAYKVKKAVDLGFLDFRSLEARRRDCHREVELNRRLAPDVYLGVADVHGPDGKPCEHMVVMERMPSERRLDLMVAAGAPVDGHLRRLAQVMAAFHAGQPRTIVADRAASAERLAQLWQGNSDALLRWGGDFIDPAMLATVDALAARYLAGRRLLFDHRIVAGRACDGHGDLQADDVFCLDDGPRVLDCLEFDDRLRCGDVIGDVAFLAMDLERLGRPDLAELFLDAYREDSGDTWPASFAHHHIAYRAQVRAKVAAIRAAQGVDEARARARSLLELALTHLERGRVRLVLVGGLPGTGKSRLAAGLGERLGATVLRSDLVRKQLAGIPPDTSAAAPVGAGIYDPASTIATYQALLDRARSALGLGESVVLDASWQDPTWRAAAVGLADDSAADLTEMRCVAPVEVARARLITRGEKGGNLSDATPEVLAAMAAHEVRWPSAVDVDTTGSAASTLDAALAQLLGAPVKRAVA